MAEKLRFLLGRKEITEEQLLYVVEHGSKIIRFCSPILHMLPVKKAFTSFPRILQARDDYARGKRWSLEDCLSLCRERDVTKKEEKLYAMLGLLDEDVRSKLPAPTSNKSAEEVYLDITKVLKDQPSWPHI
ncbi:hypothetical protein AOQ84DRAFT_382042 [Glonium stellatum]|uniref:Uncharacterized protein n=1 Tax=Glonium stellatum TaxID=574774 RepID=A0A8E2ER13_9PEZI|nr:hypothetical protein AOQ84DRAFT_382042 [Glonium stellatum]